MQNKAAQLKNLNSAWELVAKLRKWRKYTERKLKLDRLSLEKEFRKIGELMKMLSKSKV